MSCLWLQPDWQLRHQLAGQEQEYLVGQFDDRKVGCSNSGGEHVGPAAEASAVGEVGLRLNDDSQSRTLLSCVIHM